MTEPADIPRLTPDMERQTAPRRIGRLARAAAGLLVVIGLAGLTAVGLRTLHPPPAALPTPPPAAVRERVPPPEASPPPPIAQPPAPAPMRSAIEESFLVAKTPGEALQTLQAAFDADTARKDGPRDALPVIIALCEKLKAKWPMTNEAYGSMKLASRCWTQLGEAQKAREAYVAYADYNGELERRQELHRGRTPEQAQAAAMDIASREILGEAQTLFSANDFVGALSYCDVLLARYPTHERGLTALWLVGCCAAKNRQHDEAMRVFRRVIELNPDSRAADLARRSLPDLLANSGRHAEASQVWLECARRAPTEREKANYLVNAGGILVVGGESHDATAIARLERVIREYPGQDDWVRQVRRAIDAIRMRPFEKGLKGLKDPADILRL